MGTTLRLIAVTFGGVDHLRAALASMRDDGMTYVEMAERIERDHGFRVSDETVRRWCHSLQVTEGSGDGSGAA